MLSYAPENEDISACSVCLGFLLGLVFSFVLGLQLEAAHILFMFLHITELALETLVLFWEDDLCLNDFFSNELFLPK
jgi:hypothetical protein